MVFNSSLSCISKCIRILLTMINKKIVFGLFMISFTAGCAGPTAMIGPAYTLSSTGNIFQAGLSYGSGKIIKNHTDEIASSIKEKNVKKQTLESDEFYLLVKNKIEKTSNILDLTNQ